MHSFVPIRVHSWFRITPFAFPFATSRLRVSLTQHESPRTANRQLSGVRTAGSQCSCCKARATSLVPIRVHSWFQITPFAFPFASSRLRVRLTLHESLHTAWRHLSGVRAAGCQCSCWTARIAFIRAHSCSFVVPNHPFCVSLRDFASSRESHPARVTTYRKSSALRCSNRRITVLVL